MGVSGQDHRADKAEKRVENWALGHFAFGDQQEQLVKSGKTHQQMGGSQERVLPGSQGETVFKEGALSGQVLLREKDEDDQWVWQQCWPFMIWIRAVLIAVAKAMRKWRCQV